MSCVESPNFSSIPHLEFKGMDKKTMTQGKLNSDSLTIILHFNDGDGDVGSDNPDGEQNLFLIDSRTGNIAESYKIPATGSNSSGNGISGDIEIKTFTTCCLFSDNIPPCSVVEFKKTDTLRYKIFLKDNAGHVSDTVVTSDIILECK